MREVESFLDQLESLERDFGDDVPSGPRPSPDEEDRKQLALQNAPDVPKTLPEALVEELAMIELSERQRAIAEYLIWSLDEHGYLPDDRAELAVALSEEVEGDPVTPEEIEEVLRRLREVVHPALGAHDLREALRLQLEAHEIGDPLLSAIVEEHLEDVEQNRLPKIAKATGSSIEAVKEAIETLRHLDPTPVADYGENRAAAILPDVIVEEVDGDYVVRLERGAVPQLTLSSAYRDMLRRARKGEEVEKWLKKRLESARWFIDAVRQRQSTLERIAIAIFEHQRPFLDRGLSALQPLRMQEIADEVGVHISTVSRAVSGKYAQTPRGIFPLKFFFTGGTQTASGAVQSQVSIQERIKEIVAREDGSKPLSDEEIAAELERRHGVRIARRTVTKYRKMLGIPSSSQRKRF